MCARESKGRWSPIAIDIFIATEISGEGSDSEKLDIAVAGEPPSEDIDSAASENGGFEDLSDQGQEWNRPEKAEDKVDGADNPDPRGQDVFAYPADCPSVHPSGHDNLHCFRLIRKVVDWKV